MDRRKFVLGATTLAAAPAFAQPARSPKARVALVLGGGGCRGYGHSRTGDTGCITVFHAGKGTHAETRRDSWCLIALNQ